MEPKRPILITIIGVITLIAAIVALFAGIAFVIGVDGLAESIHDAIKNDEITLEDIENMMSALGVLLVAFGIVGIIIGYGLLKGWTWMWYLAVILYGIGLILSFIALVGSHTLSNVVTLVIDAVIMYYLFRPSVKSFFGV